MGQEADDVQGPVAELVDAHDLKSCALRACRFKPGRGYQLGGLFQTDGYVRNMKRVFALLVMALPLAACRSGQGSYWQSMQQYQGASEAQLIDALGPPDNHYTVEGVKYLTYSKVRQYERDSSGIGIGTGTYGHGGGVWASQRLGGTG